MSQVKMDVMTNDTSHNESKLFLGGLSWDTSEEDIRNYFNKFGQVVDVSIKYDAVTGNPRGFGFITFATSECIDNVLRNGPHTLKNKVIDPKRAKSRPISKKIFVGGIDSNTSEDEIRRYFRRYGKIEGIELPYDRQRGKRREFCFIIFESEESADAACKDPKQTIDGRECDVKKAQPQPVAQQQKRLQQSQNQGANTYPTNLFANAYGYEDYSWADPTAAAAAAAAMAAANPTSTTDSRGKKKSTSSSQQMTDPTSWDYNSFAAAGYESGYPGYAYPYGYDYFAQYGYYDYGAYGYGYDGTTTGYETSADLTTTNSLTTPSSQTSSSSSHHHHGSSSGKSSSRKSGSSSAYHPYRSNSSH